MTPLERVLFAIGFACGLKHRLPSGDVDVLIDNLIMAYLDLGGDRGLLKQYQIKVPE